MATPLSLFFIAYIFLILKSSIFSSASYGGWNNGGMQFTYSGATGPEKWGSLDPKFSSCSNGKSQSPVDIVTENVVLNHNFKPLTRDYKPSNATLVNNLFNIGLRYGVNSGELITDDKSYQLKQMHWHTPSEHTINGIQFAAELHLVHFADDGTYSVVGLLYRLGKPDPLISKIQDKLQKLGSNESILQVPLGRAFNLNEVKRTRHKYFRYSGSFTTPPCSEIVNWHILGKVRTISVEQIEALRAPLVSTCKRNSRPVQPLNGRQIQLFQYQL